MSCAACLSCCSAPGRSGDTKKKKKVKFDSIIHTSYYPAVTFDTDVCWMRTARDRVRFENRIAGIKKDIAWIFEIEHRNKILLRS